MIPKQILDSNPGSGRNLLPSPPPPPPPPTPSTCLQGVHEYHPIVSFSDPDCSKLVNSDCVACRGRAPTQRRAEFNLAQMWLAPGRYSAINIAVGNKPSRRNCRSPRRQTTAWGAMAAAQLLMWSLRLTDCIQQRSPADCRTARSSHLTPNSADSQSNTVQGGAEYFGKLCLFVTIGFFHGVSLAR